MNEFVGPPLDIEALWNKSAERLRQMTPGERRDTLVTAGILTPTGRVRKPYRRVVRFPSKPTT